MDSKQLLQQVKQLNSSFRNEFEKNGSFTEGNKDLEKKINTLLSNGTLKGELYNELNKEYTIYKGFTFILEMRYLTPQFKNETKLNTKYYNQHVFNQHANMVKELEKLDPNSNDPDIQRVIKLLNIHNAMAKMRAYMSMGGMHYAIESTPARHLLTEEMQQVIEEYKEAVEMAREFNNMELNEVRLHYLGASLYESWDNSWGEDFAKNLPTDITPKNFTETFKNYLEKRARDLGRQDEKWFANNVFTAQESEFYKELFTNVDLGKETSEPVIKLLGAFLKDPENKIFVKDLKDNPKVSKIIEEAEKIEQKPSVTKQEKVSKTTEKKEPKTTSQDKIDRNKEEIARDKKPPPLSIGREEPEGLKGGGKIEPKPPVTKQKKIPKTKDKTTLAEPPKTETSTVISPGSENDTNIAKTKSGFGLPLTIGAIAFLAGATLTALPVLGAFISKEFLGEALSQNIKNICTTVLDNAGEILGIGIGISIAIAAIATITIFASINQESQLAK